MEVVSRVARMRAIVQELRRQRRTIALVPTMGALHAGHVSLVRLARERGAEVVTSVFVNPRQFGPGEDLAAYPRDLTRDCELLVKEGVGHVFAPDADEIYPHDFSTHVEVDGLSDRLIGASRPGHFRGVATVVLKLFGIVTPDFAVFGRKDAQQLAVIRRMTRDLAVAVEIVAAPVVRDPDGLAASSRNAYLREDERRAALAIPRALREAVRLAAQGERAAQRIEDAARAVLGTEPLLEVDHVEVVDEDTFDELGQVAPGAALVAGVRVRRNDRPSIMLIDTMHLDPPEGAEEIR